MTDLQQREEQYLLILRRFVLGAARVLLVLAVLSLVGAAASGVFGTWRAYQARQVALPSGTALLSKVNPCGYLTNTEDRSNGTDPDGVIPVQRVLRRCSVALMPLQTFISDTEAVDFSVNATNVVLRKMSLQYRDKDEGRRTVRNQIQDAVRDAVSVITDSDLSSGTKDRARLLAANTIAGYYASLDGVLTESGDLVGEASKAFDHATNPRFVANQIRVTLRDALQEREERQAQSAMAYMAALSALGAAASLFALFILLMFIFVTIKIELDLRDIRDRISPSPSVE